MTTEKTNQPEEVVLAGVCRDCGGRCLHKVHVRDGIIVRIEADGSLLASLLPILTTGAEEILNRRFTSSSLVGSDLMAGSMPTRKGE